MAEVHQFSLGPLTAFSFSPDRSRVATSLNTNEIQIQVRNGNDWAVEETLAEHDKLVTSIDWAPRTNRIVTCSQDRNAYVWTYGADPATGRPTWVPTLVLLRLNRSATFVRWSPNEEKFAVASGARTVAVCQYDDESNWWVAKHLKKPIRSTVLSIDWHPNSVLLAAGTADARARVFSAFLKSADQKPTPTVWGDKLPFNTVCGEFASPSGGWVHAVAFSPSGDVLAFASHDSTVSLIYPTGAGSPAVHHVVAMPSLPALSLVFANEAALIAGGHDCQPYVFQGDGQTGWSLAKSLDQAKGGGRGGTRHANEAFNVFRAADSRGVSTTAGGTGAGGSTELNTLHSNSITSVQAYSGAPGQVGQVSTAGVDGKLIIWNVA